MDREVRPEWLFEVAERLQILILEGQDGNSLDIRERFAFDTAPPLSAFETQLCTVMLESALFQRASNLARYPQLAASRPCDVPSRMHNAVTRAASCLRNDLAKAWTVDALARHVGCNRTDLEAGFRRYLSCTIRGFLNGCRIHEAKRLLRTMPWKILEVGKSVGYRSKGSFYPNFRRITGLTPEQYRLRWRMVPVSPVVAELMNLYHD